MEPLMLAPPYVDPVFFAREADAAIDRYMDEHPDADEFEAALMWVAEIEQEEPRL